MESLEILSDKEQNGRSTPRLSPPKKEATGAPYRSTRFGFRKSSTNRPSSTGITAQKLSSCDNVTNNNHIDSKVNGN